MITNKANKRQELFIKEAMSIKKDPKINLQHSSFVPTLKLYSIDNNLHSYSKQDNVLTLFTASSNISII